MRALLAILLATTAVPAYAEQILGQSQVIAVTLYPDGAKITRKVDFTLPSAGAHELLLTDLPQNIDAYLLQVQSTADVEFGAFSLRADRLPPREDLKTAEQTEAQAKIDAAEAALRQATAQLKAIEARIAAAEAQSKFLGSFNGQLPENATPESLKAMADMIFAQTLAAAETVAGAQEALWAASEAQEKAQEAVDQAHAAYDSLPSLDNSYSALSLALEAGQAGSQSITVTHYVNDASWRPAYQMNLTRGDTSAVHVERAALISQSSGEDWTGVALTLSSARPSQQSAPSTLWPDYRHITEKEVMMRKSSQSTGLVAPAPMADMAMEAAPITAVAAYEGDTVVYNYPATVNVASGVEDLRLSLETVALDAKLRAIAVPRYDRTAFAEAEFTNTTGEPFLPGQVQLMREGVLVGRGDLPFLAAGETHEMAFGALDAIKIKRDMPVNDEGQRGVFSSSNQRVETATLVIENLGSEAWPIRVLDQISYSEQEDLTITLQADPAPSEKDVKGQRGVLAWDFDLAAGEKRQITLSQTLSWPGDKILR